MSNTRRFLPAFTLPLLLIGTAAHADFWYYTDQNGRQHFSTEKRDERYRLFAKGDKFWRDRRAVKPEAAIGAARAPLPAGKWTERIEQAARETGVDAHLLHAVIQVESGFNPLAVSPKGAKGLMQIMPDTARRYGVRNPFNPDENLRAGARYLADLLQLFASDVKLALAAYNAGEGLVLRNGGKVPRIAETENYVASVLARYKSLREYVRTGNAS